MSGLEQMSQHDLMVLKMMAGTMISGVSMIDSLCLRRWLDLAIVGMVAAISRHLGVEQSRKVTMFQIGQKVVCIDDAMNPETVDYTPCRPRKGEVYTVRGFLTQDHIEGYGLYLEELLNPSIIWSDQDEKEWPFKPERFRPLVEPKIDAEQFEQA